MSDVERDYHSEAWLQVLAAVDYFAATHRPGLTVWDALDEAVRWWTAELLDPTDGFPARRPVELPWHDPDPLRSTIESLLSAVPPAESDRAITLGDALTDALTAWLTVMAAEFNDGHRFTPPAS